MDGTLIDSEAYWFQAETRFLRRYDLKFTPAHAERYTGRSLRESVGLLRDEFNLSNSIDDLLAAKTEESDLIYKQQALALPGAEELTRALRAKEYKTAIASGSSLQRIQMIVDRLRWQGLFDELVSTDHVDYRGKPDPAIYVYTAERLGLSSAECLVIEDSVNGIKAAKLAGMTCVAVPDLRWSHGDFSMADFHIESLSDPKLYSLLGL